MAVEGGPHGARVAGEAVVRSPHDIGSEGIEVPGVGAFALPLLVDAGLPTAAYYATRVIAGDTYVSLLAGTLVAGLRVAYVAARSRRFDPIAAFLLAVFGIGVALSFVTGNPRFILAKDSVPTATTGLIFIGTCVVGRPLAYAWGRRIMARAPGQERRWARMWSSQPAFRRVFYVVSLAWGCGLLLEAAVRLPLILVLSTDAMAGLSSALSMVTVVVLAAWTVWYARWVQR